MDFKPTRSQIEIQKAAREFAKSEFDKDLAAEMDKTGTFPHAIRQKASELGFTSINLDEEYLGGGLGFLENVLTAEELCRKDSTVGSALMLSGYGAEMLQSCSNTELRSEYLTGLAEGRYISGAAVTVNELTNQPDDVSVMAAKENGEWVINGKACNIVNAGVCNFYILLCRTDAGASSREAYSMILAEKEREGMTLLDTGAKLGLRMTCLADLEMKNVRIPLDNFLNSEGKGLSLFASFADKSRVLLAALALGTGQGVMERAVDYVKQREQFGKKIASFQVTRHKLARMVARIEQARWLVYRSAWLIDQKKVDNTFTAMVKLTTTETALSCAHEAIQLLGGYGYSTEYDVERFCRDAKALHLLGGHPGQLLDDVAAGVIGKIK